MNLFKQFLDEGRATAGKSRAAFAGTARADLHPFLYACIGDENNGMQLSVLSVLARQDLDAWEQAGVWSRASEGVAIRELSTLIAALPEGPSDRPRPEQIAARLVRLLPSELAVDVEATRGLTRAQKLQVTIFCAVFALMCHWIIAGFETSSREGAAAAPVSSGSVASGSPKSSDR
jgi:hypothetical protein